MTRIACTIILAALISVAPFQAGCQSSGGTSPYAPHSEAARDPLTAQRLTMQAADLMDTDQDQAEQLLQQALTADAFHGPAHNNLGVLMLRKDLLYEAANEFEWARKLMPGHPDPRMNLALTLERAGRIDEALTTYDTALEVYPNHLPTLQALSRCQLRNGQPDQRTPGMLKQIALRGDTLLWRDWARLQLTKLEGRPGGE